MTTQIVAATVNPYNVSVVVRNTLTNKLQPYNVSVGHPNFDVIRENVLAGDVTNLDTLVNVARAVESWANKATVALDMGHITVEFGVIKFAGEPIHNSLTERILSMMDDGEDATPLLKFLNNVQANPSEVAREELFSFLEGNSLPITKDGTFLAYKRVNHRLYDIYTNSMDNSPGKTVQMDRTKVDPCRHNTCSAGLHFASLTYARDHYGCGNGDKMVVVEINPADVVAIPTDYNRQKGRAWKYKVIGEVALETLQEVDLLENISVLNVEEYDNETLEQDFTEFLREKARKQRRDSTGRFVR
jgi:sorbitol-specific phosphotransferase system component IIA